MKTFFFSRYTVSVFLVVLATKGNEKAKETKNNNDLVSRFVFTYPEIVSLGGGLLAGRVLTTLAKIARTAWAY